MDVRREKMDVRWVGFHPLKLTTSLFDDEEKKFKITSTTAPHKYKP
jgi:hypothetical protein